MKKKKSAITILLCFVFCLTMLPLSAFAQDIEPVFESELMEAAPEPAESVPETELEAEPEPEPESEYAQVSEVVQEDTAVAADAESPAAEGPSEPVYEDENAYGEDLTEDEAGLPAEDEEKLLSKEEANGDPSEAADASDELLTVELSSTAEQTAPATEAEQEEYVSVPLNGEYSFFYAQDSMSNNADLLDAYAAQQFGLTDRPTLMSPTNPTAGLSAAEMEVYQILSAFIKETAAGSRSSTQYSGELQNAVWNSDAMGFGPLSSDNIEDVLSYVFGSEFRMDLVYNALVFSLPYELYWHDTTTGFGASFSYSFDFDQGTVSIVSVRFTLAVAGAYSNGETTTIKDGNGEDLTVNCGVNDVGSKITAAVNHAADIINASASSGDLEKLTAYKDRICGLVSYNQQAVDENWDYGDPWQLIWVFDNDPTTNVVCEGYSKAFEYLCDNSSFSSPLINCYTATGSMTGANGAGPHMWNIVTMDDGCNYLADITNCDEGSIGAPDLLFLKGYAEAPEEGVQYIYQANGSSIVYEYDDDSISFYSGPERSLSGSDYGEEASEFDRLEAACRAGEDYTISSQKLVIVRDLLIPAGVSVNVQDEDGILTVPANITLRVEGELTTPGVKIEAGGILYGNAEAVVEVYQQMVIEQAGGLVLDAAWLIIGSDAWDDTLMEKITCTNGGDITVFESLSSVEEFYQKLDSHSVTDPSLYREYDFDSSSELTRDNTIIPENMAMVIRNTSLSIPEGKTLTLLEGAELVVVGGELNLNGTMINKGSVRLYYSYDGVPTIVTVGENGIYSTESSGTVTYNNSTYEIISNKSLFAQLEKACKDENIHFFDLSNRGDFVLGDLIFPKEFYLEAYGTNIIVPNNVTLTVEEGAEFQVHQLSVEAGGKVTVEQNARINIYDEVRVEGDINLGYDAEGHFPAGGMDASARSRVHAENESRATIHYNVTDVDSLYRAKNEAEQLQEPFNGNLQLQFPWTLEDNISFDDSVGLDVDGAWNEGKIVIPEGKTLTVNSYLNIRGGSLTVLGTLQNNGWIELRAEENEDPNCNREMGQIVVQNGGSYRGPGHLFVATETDPDRYLQMDLTGFEKTMADGGTHYTNAAELVEEFLDACANPEKYNNYYDRLSDQGSFTIPTTQNGELVIPETLQINCWNTVIVVPAPMTLKVSGQFFTNNLQVAPGARVIVKETGALGINDSLELNGSIAVENTWFSVPVNSWDSAWVDNGMLEFIGEDAGIEVEIPAFSPEDIASAPSRVQIAEHIRPSIFVRFDWELSENLTTDQGANFHIQNEPQMNWSGKLTILPGVTLKNMGYFGLHNAELVVKGTLENEGFIDVRQDEETVSRIVMDGGSYDGFGWIRVGTRTNPEQFLVGLADSSSYTFSRESDSEGTVFQKTVGFEWLKTMCSQTYQVDEDNYREIPNFGRFTIEESLTVPLNLHISDWSGELYVPSGVTLTIEGMMDCRQLTVDGEIVIKEDAWLNVHEELNLGGHINIENDGHMDLNAALWTDDFNDKILLGEDNAWVNLYFDARSEGEAKSGLNLLNGLNTKEQIGKSLNILFPWTLSEDLELPEGVGLNISAGWDDQNGSLIVPQEVRLTVNDFLRIADADVIVYGTLVNHGRIELVRENWDTEANGRFGVLDLEIGGSYQGEGEIWINTVVAPQDYVIGFPQGFLTEEQFEYDTLFRHQHTVVTVHENEAEATCTQNGSYDEVSRCSTCQEEISRVHYETDLIPHSYGESMWYWYNNDSNAMARFQCSVCGDEVDEEATVTVVPGSNEREFVYTATVTFNGNTYTDTKNVTKSQYKLDRNSLNIICGETGQLHLLDKDTQSAADYEGVLTWTVRDESIATVDANGTIKALKVGFTWVFVSSEDKEIDEECQLFVLFSDVANFDDYYYAPVYWAVNQGVTSGTSATTFSPYNACTRAQIVTFLWKASGSPVVSGANPFTDVSSSDYFFNAVLWAVSKGITSGTSATTFSPYNSCTRAQCMTFLWKASGSPVVSGANPFTDVSSSDYFYNAVLWAVSRGITAGTSATTFSPYNSCTRAQCMTFLYRAVNEA